MQRRETFLTLSSVRSLTRRENFSAARKLLVDAKILKKNRVVAIDSVQKSSKSELSSRFLSRLKFVLRTRGMFCFEHKECPASNTRTSLLRIQGMSCFEHKECPASNIRNVLLRTQGMSRFKHKECLASNARNVLLRTQGMFCFEHKECPAWNTLRSERQKFPSDAHVQL